MVGRWKLKIRSIIVVTSGLATLAFTQSQNGTKVGGSSAPKSSPAPSSLDSKGSNKGAIQTKPVLDVRDVAGVDCTGATDSASALNALTGHFPKTDNAISGRTLSFGGCRSIKLSNTWLIKNQAGFIIDGRTRSGAAGKGIHVRWAGAASGTMIDMEYVDGFTVRGLFLNGGANGGIGIQIDKNGAGGIWNTTDGILKDDSFTGAASNWVGVSISPVSTQNVEDIRVEDSSFYCNAAVATTAAVGVLVGNSANAKNEIVKHITVTNCLYGVYKKNGSIQIRESEFTGNGGTCGSGSGADIRIDSNSDVDIIDGNLDENSLQGIRAGGTGGMGMGHPVIVNGNHAAPAGCEKVSSYWFDTGSASNSWEITGNSWDSDSNLVNVIGSSFGGVQGQHIYTSGNLYPNTRFNTWWTLGDSAVGDDVQVSGENLIVYAARAGGSIPQAGSNYPSPFQVFRGYLNGSLTADDFAVQNIPAGTDGSSGGTFLIKHQQGATGTEIFGWDGSYPGINVAQISTPTIASVTPQGSAGSTAYTYAIVAYGPLGNTAGSATVSTFTGNATLTSSNYNQIQYDSVAGATKYCFWRMVSGGTPSSTGNIGCQSALQINYRYYPNAWSTAYTLNNAGLRNHYLFRDTGLAGDSASLPGSNTTGTLSLPGQITSTLATGTAPFSIGSTTPVANLTLTAHPQVYEAGVLTTSEKTYTNTQALAAGAATHTFANGFTFTSTRTFGCTCTDETAANACRAVPASATAVILAGTGSDVLWLQCAGH